MFKKIPFQLSFFLLALLFYNGYAFYLSMQAHTSYRNMIDYWAWVDAGGKIVLFMIGFSGIVWALQSSIGSFVVRSLSTSLILYLLQLLIASTIFHEVEIPLFSNALFSGWGETKMGWGDVKPATPYIINGLWAVSGLIGSWLVYAITRWRKNPV